MARLRALIHSRSGKRFRRLPRLLALTGLLLIATLALAGAPTLHAQDTPLQPSPTYDPTQVTVPLAPPNARAGRPIFTENCAPCHGDTGLGDGPDAAKLNVQPAPFGDPTFVWDRLPAEMFHVTKFGRMQNFMPPFLGSLDDSQIWNTVWYAWSLHTSEDEVTAGQALYAASCANCHGETGQGDGPDAEGDLVDLSDQATLINASNNDWLVGWQEAHPELGADWSLNEQTAAIEYMRTFGYAPPWQSPWVAGQGAIRGTVEAGTPGGPEPEGLVAAVDAFLEFDRVATFTTTVAADGTFEFTNLSTDPTLNYITSVLAEGISYSSDFINLSPQTPVAETSITVYGTTDDPTVLTVDRLHWIVEAEAGALLVGQIFAVGNTSDRTFTGTESAGAPEPVTFAMQLPPNAQQVEFESGVLGDRFHQVGPVIYDTLPVLPGAGTRQIIARYVVPLETDSVTLDQALLYPVADMSLLVADFEGLNANATGLTFQSIQQMGDRAYQFWEATNLEPQTISVALAGLPLAGEPSPFGETTSAASGASAGAATTTDAFTATRTPPPEPWMAATIAGVVTAGLAGVLLWALSSGALRRGYSRSDLLTLREMLLDQVAHLDDQHAIGDLSDNDWMRQRAQLKVQLVDVYSRLERGKQKAA